MPLPPLIPHHSKSLLRLDSFNTTTAGDPPSSSDGLRGAVVGDPPPRARSLQARNRLAPSSSEGRCLQCRLDQAQDFPIDDPLLDVAHDDLGGEALDDVSELDLDELEVADEVGAEGANGDVRAATRAEDMGIGGEAGLKNGLEDEEVELLEDTILEGGRGGVEENLELVAGMERRRKWVAAPQRWGTRPPSRG